MILNLVFIATCLPVVTIGASLTALNFASMRIATGMCDSVTSDYARSFRRNLRQATVLGLVLVLLAGVLAAWFVVLTNLALGAIVELILLVVWYIVAFTFVMTALYVFPYLAKFEGRTREVLRNARLLSWKHPVGSLTVLSVIALSVAVTVFTPQATGYGLLWLVIGFAGVATVNGLVFARIFSKYTASTSVEE
ncbi:YesL family protein [Agromyces intestinalis]|nr:DUF624 domain-containing protein [Agromyces intestinalis]